MSIFMELEGVPFVRDDKFNLFRMDGDNWVEIFDSESRVRIESNSVEISEEEARELAWEWVSSFEENSVENL